MWKIVAVFLLLLVLAGVSAMNNEGLSWMLTVFFALLGVGIFIYAYGMYKSARKSSAQIKQIKSAMGETELKNDLKELKVEAAQQTTNTKIDAPVISHPEHPADGADHDEIHITKLDIPIVEPVKISQEVQIPAATQSEFSENKQDGEAISIDLVKLRAKIKDKPDD